MIYLLSFWLKYSCATVHLQFMSDSSPSKSQIIVSCQHSYHCQWLWIYQCNVTPCWRQRWNDAVIYQTNYIVMTSLWWHLLVASDLISTAESVRSTSVPGRSQMQLTARHRQKAVICRVHTMAIVQQRPRRPVSQRIGPPRVWSSHRSGVIAKSH